jgi:magnesium transporter
MADLLDGDVFAEMNDWVRDELIDALEPHEVAEIAGQLDTDDAVAMIEDMEEDEQRAVLRALDPDDRAAIEEALTFPEESAGRLMRRDYVAVPEHWIVGQMIDYLRAGEDLTTDFWEIYVVDPQHRPVGTVLLSWILRTPRNFAVADLMQREQTPDPGRHGPGGSGAPLPEIRADLGRRWSISRPAGGHDHRRRRGPHHPGGSQRGRAAAFGVGEGDINEPVIDSYKSRVRWLIANLGTALVAATIISLFEATISRMVALAALMPIVAGVGGNAGTQTLAVTVRALAINQLTQSNTMRAIVRELKVAVLNGITVAILIGLGVSLFFANPTLGAVIAAAMLTNIVIAGCAGVLVPLALDRAGADPAVASSVFVTMVTDSMGFLVFLGLASASGLVG